MPPPKKIRPPAKKALHKAASILSDGRAANGGSRAGAGRHPWVPRQSRVQDDTGRWRIQSDEEAWDDARALVRHYVWMEYPPEAIGKYMSPPCSESTLRKKFIFELEEGRMIQNARIAGTAYRMGTSGRDGNMTRYLLRVRMGWVEKADLGNGAPVQIQFIPGDESL